MMRMEPSTNNNDWGSELLAFRSGYLMEARLQLGHEERGVSFVNLVERVSRRATKVLYRDNRFARLRNGFQMLYGIGLKVRAWNQSIAESAFLGHVIMRPLILVWEMLINGLEETVILVAAQNTEMPHVDFLEVSWFFKEG